MHAQSVASSVVIFAQEGGGLAAFLPLILLVVIFYLLLIRPQQKRQRQQRQLVGSIEVGDRVVTIGGVHGTVTFVDEDTMHLEVAPGTTVTFARQAVARRLVDAGESS